MAVSYSKWKLRAKNLSGTYIDGVATYTKEDGLSYMLTTSGEVRIQPNTTTMYLNKVGSTQSYFGDILKLVPKTGGGKPVSYVKHTIDLDPRYLDATLYTTTIHKTFDKTSEIKSIGFFPCTRSQFFFRGRKSTGEWVYGTGVYLDGSTEKLVLSDGTIVDIVAGTGSPNIYVDQNKTLYFGDIVSIGYQEKEFKLVSYGSRIPCGKLEGNQWDNTAMAALCQ